jgi:hypothetical protein
MSSDNKQFLMNQLIWMGISIGISLTLSLLIPFPISIITIIGTFLLLNFYLTRRMITRTGGINNSLMGAGMFNPTTTYGPMKYYCMSCGTQHKQIACPKCGSKMKLPIVQLCENYPPYIFLNKIIIK